MPLSPSQSQTLPPSQEPEDEIMTEADAAPNSPSSPAQLNSNFPYSGSQPSNIGRANGDGSGATGGHISISGGNNAKVNYGAPGSSWATKKYLEELEKAKLLVLDAGWDPRKYGDPLAEG